MVMKSKKIKYLLIVFLTLLELSSLFLAWKSLSHKVTIIDDVRFKEENEKEKKTIAIMLNEGDGSYKESASTTFPKEGYIYNTQKSGCIDTTGKEVVNAINYESGKVSLRLNQKLYCYLYFNKKEKTIIDKFYINDEISNKTTKVPELTIYLKWSDPYIKEYCIIETQNIDSCTWQNTNGVTEITSNYTFTEQTTKTFYAYIKDIAEGVSEVKSDSITYADTKNGNDLVSNPIPGVLESTGVIEDELTVRYYGTTPPNYICFGTSDKETCVNDTDKYMYRIIGIDKSGRFKIIKKEALNATYKWHNISSSDIKWPESDLYKGLNGISGGKYNDLFIGNIDYITSGWIGKIADVYWKYGDFFELDATPIKILKTEQSSSLKIFSKIGLIYLTDYYYSYTKTGLDCNSVTAGDSKCKTSWINLNINDVIPPNKLQEWSITRYGLNNGSRYYAAWNISSVGLCNRGNIVNMNSVRPVFYLIPSIEISGSGTQTDPYIIVN